MNKVTTKASERIDKSLSLGMILASVLLVGVGVSHASVLPTENGSTAVHKVIEEGDGGQAGVESQKRTIAPVDSTNRSDGVVASKP